MREERKKVWVDEFQTKLLWRCFSYWALYTLALWNLLFVWWLVQQDAGNPVDQLVEFSAQFYPALIAFLVAFPVLAYDALKFSHRLVGPLYRFRTAMQLRAAGLRVDLYPDQDRFGKQFKYAEERGIRYAVLVSPRELEAGVVAIKDLLTGEQVDVAPGEAATWREKRV